MVTHRRQRTSGDDRQKALLLVTLALLALASQTNCKPLTDMVATQGAALRGSSAAPEASNATAGAGASLAGETAAVL